MIVEKYKYDELKRTTTDKQRLYTCPDGKAVPSVTTILDKTKPEKNRKALENWRKAVGEQKAKAITTEAAHRGTRMHTYLENYVLGEELKETVSNPYAQQSLDMAKIVIKEGLKNVDEYWGTEVALYHPEIYAGTTDLVGVHSGADAILDFKQSNKVKKREYVEDYFLQLCAYAEAHNKMYDTQIKTGRIFICTQNNEYQTFDIDNYDHWVGQWYAKLEQYYKKIL